VFDEKNKAHKLLEKFCLYSKKKLLERYPKVVQYLNDRGIDKDDIDKFLIGYSDDKNSLSNQLKGDDLELAIHLGLINKSGKNGSLFDNFQHRLILPVWNYGKIVFLTGRSYPEGEPKYLHLKKSELLTKEIAFKENLNKERCIITEGILDAISFVKSGFPAVAMLGTNPGSLEDISKTKSIKYICFDDDEAGRTASLKLAKQLQAYILDLNLNENEDPNDLYVRVGKDGFVNTVNNSLKSAHYYLDKMIETVEIDEVLSEINKFDKEYKKEQWLKKLSKQHEISISSLKKDLNNLNIINKREATEKEKDTDFDPFSEYTEDEIGIANELLKEEDILKKIEELITRSGYVGEVRNKKLVYLACTSRKLPGKKKAISLITKGESGSGKSDLVNRVFKLIPTRDIKEFTYITSKALLHTLDDLSNKILCVLEREGGEQSDYTIRTALSEEKISIMMSVKNPETGNWEAIEKKIPAKGLVYIETTVKDDTDPQNASRTFEFFTDSSPEQTRKVLHAQAATYNEDLLESEFKIFRCLQELLEPIPTEIPFAEELAEQFPVNQVRARRDFPRLLALIEVSAFLHQKNRTKKEINGVEHIIANDIDLKNSMEIVEPILSQTYKGLTPKEEKLISVIKDQFGIGSFADSDIEESKDINVFGVGDLHNSIKDEFPEFRAYSSLRNDIKGLSLKGMIGWNGLKGSGSKYCLISDSPKYSLNILVSSLANTPKMQKKAIMTIS